jgi:hypothetical protein
MDTQKIVVVVKKVTFTSLSNQQEQQLRYAFDLLVAELVKNEVRRRKEQRREQEKPRTEKLHDDCPHRLR